MQMTRSSILIAITLTLLVSNAAGNPFLHTNLAAHLLQEYPIVNTVSSRDGGCGNASFSFCDRHILCFKIEYDLLRSANPKACLAPRGSSSDQLNATIGQYDYQKKGYVPPPISGATRCVKNAGTGNTPALCPGAVPLTDEGKPGSTQCVTAVNGTVNAPVNHLPDEEAAHGGFANLDRCWRV